MTIRKTLNYIHDHGAAGSRVYVQTRFCPFGSQTCTKHPGLIITSRKICAQLSPFAQWKKAKRSRDLLHIPECVRRSHDDSPQAPCPLQVVLRTNHSSVWISEIYNEGIANKHLLNSFWFFRRKYEHPSLFISALGNKGLGKVEYIQCSPCFRTVYSLTMTWISGKLYLLFPGYSISKLPFSMNWRQNFLEGHSCNLQILPKTVKSTSWS